LARLEAALGWARAGQPGIVVVTGEAGIGKTSLIETFLVRGATEGWLHIGGTCLELHAGQAAYLPFVEALRALVAQVPPARVRSIVWPARDELGRLLPELAGSTDTRRAATMPADPVGGEGGVLDRARLFEALLTVAQRLTGAQPLLVTIEDLQWADAGTLDLLRFFAHNVRTGPVLLLLTLRTEGPGRPAPLLRYVGDLERFARLERIELGPLDRADVASLLAAVEGRAPDPSRVVTLTVRSGGNPYLVEEMIRSGLGEPAASADVPAGLRDLLLARVAELSDVAQIVVRVASVAGRMIDDRLLIRVSGLPEGDAVRGLHEAIDRGVLALPGAGVGVTFRHPLLREVVAESLLPIEARRLHAAFAEALSATGHRSGGPDGVATAEMAYHWDAAGEVGRALEATVEAAAEAEAVYAFDEARILYERALRLWDLAPYPDDRLPLDRLALLDRAAATAALVGDPARAIELAREALTIVDPDAEPERAALFHSRLRWYLWDAGDRPAALRDALEAVRLMPAEPPTAALANVSAHAAGLLVFAGRIGEAATEATATLRIARAVSARPEEALALGVLGWVAVQQGEHERGVELVREAWRIAQELGHVTGLQLAYSHLAAVLDISGRVSESLSIAREGIALAERLGTARSFGALLEGSAAHALLRLGRWPEADTMTSAVLARGATGGALVWLRIVRARLEIGRGRFAEAEAQLRAIDPSTDAVALAPYVGWWQVARTEACLWQADPEPALGLVRAALADDRLPAVDASVATLVALGLRAAADIAESNPPGSAEADAARAGGHELETRVRRLRRSGRSEAPDLPTGGPLGGKGQPTSRVALIDAELSRLGDRPSPTAWRRLVSAAEVEERAPLAAYGRYRQAAALLAANGDREEAADALRAAYVSATDLDARPLMSLVEDLGRRARLGVGDVRSASDASGVPFGLTERELEVLALVVAGHSNREIGEVLFISPKTASVHVSNILGKMGVDSRLEAATTALRMGLVAHQGAGVGEGTGRDRRPAN
jgi:DNA-binding NarL/FixJ family response regulator